MALDFGKLNFSVSFNPTSAFPIDARSYFESYDAAEKAALSAKQVGDSTTTYYYGQTLVVVENNIASFYIIQPNNILAPVGANIDVNPQVFEFDSEGNLSLKGFEQATAGQLLTIGSNGQLYYTNPIDAYTKAEVYTKGETDIAIAAAVVKAGHLQRKIVSSVEEINKYLNDENVTQYIFLVPTSNILLQDSYDEYIVVEQTRIDGEGISTTYKQIEKLGSWETDLTDYAKTSEVEALLNNKVDKVAGARLATENELQKLENLLNIQSLSTDFKIDNNQLQLNPISITNISGLETLLEHKVDKQEGYGLSQNNLTDALYNKLNNSLSITEVESSELQIEAGKLSIVSIEPAKISNLANMLNEKANQSALEASNQKIATLEEQLNSYVKITTYEDDISKLRDALTWKEMK